MFSTEQSSTNKASMVRKVTEPVLLVKRLLYIENECNVHC